MTWYPNIKDDAFPWSLVYIPTEPLLAPTRKIITPVGCDCVCRRCCATATI
jgi:YggT family protein